MGEVLEKRRVVFVSASFASKQYKTIPASVLQESVFFFGGQRSWLFPANREELQEAKEHPAKYLQFDEDFKSLVLEKEEAGLCIWVKSVGYKKASELIEKIVDPVSDEHYLPLVLDEKWWKNDFNSKDAKFTHNPDQVINNFNSNDHDYDAVMELIYQSNPTLDPKLYWDSKAEER